MILTLHEIQYEDRRHLHCTDPRLSIKASSREQRNREPKFRSCIGSSIYGNRYQFWSDRRERQVGS